MKDNLEQFFQDARSIRLADSERSAMRSRLADAMGTLAAPAQGLGHALVAMMEGHGRLLAYASFFIALATVSYYAQSALPGDALYPAKASLGNSLTRLFIESPEGQMEWDISLAEQQMAETEQVATDLGF